MKARGIPFALGFVLIVSPARAEDAPECAPITRANVAPCVVRASAAIRREHEATAAARGRHVATQPWFPSNPTLAVTLARRAGTEGRADATNYTASLSQEVQIAGQRGARRRAAEADLQARREEASATARRVAADGYVAYFDVLAARQAWALARRLEATAQQTAKIARGRAEAGVLSAIDAEIAESAALRVAQTTLAAERELRSASSHLAALLGRAPAGAAGPEVKGSLDPLEAADSLAQTANPASVRDRPEVRALANEKKSWEERADALRRSRVPSLTLQFFAQNDGYNERVFGGGLSVPLPLPQPVGHTFAGEIQEADAFARQADARSEVAARELGAELAIAASNYESRRAEAALFTPERLERTERILAELGKELEAGRLPTRDALLAQQQFIDLLRSAVEARRALCLASVDLAFAAGVPLDGAGR